jgi:predicted aminopeptidase
LVYLLLFRLAGASAVIQLLDFISILFNPHYSQLDLAMFLNRISLRKKILYAILTLLLLVFLWYLPLIIYGIRQGIGQLNIVWNTQTFEDFLAKGDYPDSTKQMYRHKIELIKNIKRFAIDSLGLNDTDNYNRIFDQKNKPILWAVSASEAFELKPKEWNYGPLGNMPYKGYFDSTSAYQLLKSLEKSGYDVHIYSPAAWSTLGWFADPVLSSMLHWDEADLASLIIHEMTHSTIWVYGGVEFNENLADFIGERGAILYLESKYGKNAPQIRKYLQSDKDGQRYYEHILRGAEKLDSLYKSFQSDDKYQHKYDLKYKLIRRIIETMDTLALSKPRRAGRRIQKKLPNNAFFMNFRRYRGRQNQFEQEWKQKYSSDLKKYIAYLKDKFPA